MNVFGAIAFAALMTFLIMAVIKGLAPKQFNASALTSKLAHSLEVGDEVICKNINELVNTCAELRLIGICTCWDDKLANQGRYVLCVYHRLDPEEMDEEDGYDDRGAD